MFQVLIQIGPLSISVLGIFLTLGFFMASFLVWQRGREDHLEELYLMDGIILTSFVGLLSSRVWFCLENWSQGISLFDLIAKPGFSWVGGLIGGIIAFNWWCRKQKWDFYKVADLAVFGLAFALILGKIGKFITFINLQNFYKLGSFYEIILLLVVFRLLHILERDYRTYDWYKDKRGESHPGFLFLTFVALTSLIFWVGDIAAQNFQYKSFHQNSFLFLFLISLVLFYYRTGRGLTISLPSFKKKRRPVWDAKISKERIKTGMEVK